ncbi:MAG: hypothetical protein LBN74_03905 [Prevotella sp.]|nr:hypothetical protein [Prevotella sp.]
MKIKLCTKIVYFYYTKHGLPAMQAGLMIAHLEQYAERTAYRGMLSDRALYLV